MSSSMKFALALLGAILLVSSFDNANSMIHRYRKGDKLMKTIFNFVETTVSTVKKEDGFRSMDTFNMVENETVPAHENNSKTMCPKEDYKSQTSAFYPIDIFNSFGLSAKVQQDSNILEAVTTRVGGTGFDPLVQERKVHKFVPILEARGGSDKDKAGHRKDSLPLANAIVNVSTQSVNSAVFQFLEEDCAENVMSNDALARVLKRLAHGIIVRINPGTLSAATHHKIDNLLRELANEGIVVMNHPDVSSTLGAKDALHKIRFLKSGLPDTAVYYDSDSFQRGFCENIASGSRVIKQNRGSQGEGVWICELVDDIEEGQLSVPLNATLKLTEANDGHIEYHSVGEFIEFCINGRTEKSRSWTSLGDGKYFDGGIEAGAMIVDQRFLPRIAEGEVRLMMVGDKLIDLLHKKPKDGGVSATLQSGAIYTKYAVDDQRFRKLVAKFNADAPKIMDSFGFENQPLPLLWTADYILGESEDDYHIGEINSSCVGLTTQLDLIPIIVQ